jgi:hypothetical protein
MGEAVMAKRWYYMPASSIGKKQGPVTDEELKALADRGQLRPDDKIWREGMDGWKVAKAIKGLFPVTLPAVAADSDRNSVGASDPGRSEDPPETEPGIAGDHRRSSSDEKKPNPVGGKSGRGNRVLLGVAGAVVILVGTAAAYFWLVGFFEPNPTLSEPISLPDHTRLSMAGVTDFSHNRFVITSIMGVEFAGSLPVHALRPGPPEILGKIDPVTGVLTPPETRLTPHHIAGSKYVHSDFAVDLKAKDGAEYTLHLNLGRSVVAMTNRQSNTNMTPVYEQDGGHRRVYLTTARGFSLHQPNGWVGQVSFTEVVPVIGSANSYQGCMSADSTRNTSENNIYGIAKKPLAANPAPKEYAALPDVSSKRAPRVLELKGSDGAGYVLFASESGEFSVLTSRKWAKENVWR